jgi:AcrR family transcriptional regulator
MWKMARTKDSEKPSQIIEAAFSVFGDIGYEATVIRDIADRAGISSGTIYTYFKGKKDLFQATVTEGWSRFLAHMRALAESSEPREVRLERFVDHGFRSLKSSLPLLRGMLFESSQMNLLQGSIEQLCALVEGLVADRRERAVRIAADPEQRRSLIRLTVVGVLFTAALADPLRVDAEIDGLRRTISLLIVEG